MHSRSAKEEKSREQRSLADSLSTTPKELGVVTELRRLRRRLGIGACQPIAALPLAAACDAPGASLVRGHAPVDASCRGRIDADALHHAVHQLGLANDTVQHRSAVTEVAHGISSSLASFKY